MSFATLLAFVILLPFGTEARTTNIPVPFTPQAPDGVWTLPWGLACEEAVTVMIDAYYGGKTLTRAEARARILEMVRKENKYFGYNGDTSAAQTGEFINRFYPWQTVLVKNPTVRQIEEELNAGRPVIVPVNIAEIKNRHFRSSKPGYHLLLLSGYDAQTREFISQEPGTRHGANYRYSYDTLMAANHEFVPGQNIELGEKVMLFTRPE